MEENSRCNKRRLDKHESATNPRFSTDGLFQRRLAGGIWLSDGTATTARVIKVEPWAIRERTFR